MVPLATMTSPCGGGQPATAVGRGVPRPNNRQTPKRMFQNATGLDAFRARYKKNPSLWERKFVARRSLLELGDNAWGDFYDTFRGLAVYGMITGR